ncbi:MAG TPA: hypothetical protein VFS15_08525, partial [Kofleriaceae bacterium]|nr:hypothetical protein [Kofleriaceae bacterium]
ECIADVAPSEVPAALVTRCDALPTTVTGKLECIQGAAPASDPVCLVDHCVAAFATISAQLDCIANNEGVPAGT